MHNGQKFTKYPNTVHTKSHPHIPKVLSNLQIKIKIKIESDVKSINKNVILHLWPLKD